MIYDHGRIILGNNDKKITRKPQYVWKLINAFLNNLSPKRNYNWNCFELPDDGNSKFGDATLLEKNLLV